jgi:hypothetical protein
MKSLFSQQFDTIEKDNVDDIKPSTSFAARSPTMDPNFNRGEALDIWRQMTGDSQNDVPTIKPRNVLKASKTFESKKMSVQPENTITLIPAAIGAHDDDFLFDTEEQEMTQKLETYESQEEKPQNHSIISLT